MNKKDVPVLIAIVGFAALMSYFIVGQVIAPPSNRQQEVEVATAITSEFNIPTDKKYFNTESINPTKLIEIGPNSNGQPFVVQP